MMKKSFQLFLIACLCFLHAKAQYIFDSTVAFKYVIPDTAKRFTPTAAEVKTAETYLKAGIVDFTREYKYGNGKPVVNTNLGLFLRQYFGYLNEQGEKIILINFFRKEKQALVKKAKTEIIEVEDGGNDYWKIEVNLDAKALRNLSVNSIGG
jgi:hypothetical protein